MYRLARFISVAATPVVAAALVLSASPSAHADPITFTPGSVSTGSELRDYPAAARETTLRSGKVTKTGAVVLNAAKWTGVRAPSGRFSWQAIAMDDTGKVSTAHGTTRRTIVLPRSLDGDLMITVHATRPDGSRSTTIGYSSTHTPGVFTAAPVGVFAR